MNTPAYPGYFADPFILRVDDGYVAYGGSGAAIQGGDAVEVLESPDLRSWRSRGHALALADATPGDECWAAEVLHFSNAFWMFYSIGSGISGHHIRVARAANAFGPFVDQGVNLTPGERFAIDAHPFMDADGRLYLFFARDVLDAERPGTHLAVVELSSPTTTGGSPLPVLEPHADWQIYESDRLMYGDRFDWHTLEGPSVVHRGGRYWLTYSGGAWTGPGYAVSWAVADSLLGPWSHAPEGTPPVLASSDEYLGPGHNSLTIDPDGRDVIAFHAWDKSHSLRQMHLRFISFEPEGPRLDGPI